MAIASFVELLGLGLVAGALTTIAGMGGGLFLVLTLSLTHGPLAALGITSPALFFSNSHRAWLFRRHVVGGAVARFALGAVPLAIAGGLVAAKLPLAAVQLAMLGLAFFAVLRSLGGVRYAPGPRVFVPLSAFVGFLSAGAGAAGFLSGPLFMALGLSGSAYIGTTALGAVVLHAARLVGYGAGGILKLEYAALSVALFVGLVLGNLAGKRLRAHLSATTEQRIELGALVLAAALGIAGIH